MKRAFWGLYARWCSISLFLGFFCFILASPGGIFFKTDQFSRFALRAVRWLYSAVWVLLEALAGFV